MEGNKNVGDVQQTSLSIWKWTIRNYTDHLTRRKEIVYSPNFSALYYNDITNWRFEIYSHDKDEKNKKFFTVILTNLDEADTTASCEFSVLNESNDVVHNQSAFSQEIFSKRDGKSRGISHFISHEFLNDKSNRALTYNTLKLQIRFLVGPKFYSVQMKDDFEELMDSLKYSDVTICVEEKKLHLHKTMLAARSPVFEAMFQYNMQQSRKNTVTITDIKLNVVKEMFRYIYSGKVLGIDCIASDLLIAADKYCMNELKLLCEKTICDQLNNDNVLEYLQLARTYNAQFLKSNISDFVKMNIKILFPTPKFQNLDREILVEIFWILLGEKREAKLI